MFVLLVGQSAGDVRVIEVLLIRSLDMVICLKLVGFENRGG